MKISLRAKGATGAKVWIAETTSQGVLISYGTLGRRLRTQTIPLFACQNGSAEDEALSRASAKRLKGYEDNPDDVDTGKLTASTKPKSRPTLLGLGDIKVNNWF